MSVIRLFGWVKICSRHGFVQRFAEQWAMLTRSALWEIFESPTVLINIFVFKSCHPDDAIFFRRLIAIKKYWNTCGKCWHFGKDKYFSYVVQVVNYFDNLRCWELFASWCNFAISNDIKTSVGISLHWVTSRLFTAAQECTRDFRCGNYFLK